jgi:hypothetical protein
MPNSSILNECKELGVPINKLKNMEVFVNALGTVTKEKKKAANLLYEEIEQDVAEKEKFVMEQKENL